MQIGSSTSSTSNSTNKAPFKLRLLPQPKMSPASKKGFGVKVKPKEQTETKETTAVTKVSTPKITTNYFKVFSSDEDDSKSKNDHVKKSKTKPAAAAKEMNGKKKPETGSSSDTSEDDGRRQKALDARTGAKPKMSPVKQSDKKKAQSKLSDASTDESSDEEDTAAAKGKSKRSKQSPVRQNDKGSKKKKAETTSESEEEEPAPPVRKPSLNSAKQTTSKAKTPQKAPPPESDASEDENSDEEDRDDQPKAGDKTPTKNPTTVDPKKMSDITEGHSVGLSMPVDDFKDFIQRLKESCDVLEKHRPSKTIEAMDWDKFAFKDYTGAELRKVCLFMIYKRRSTRNLWEYVNEVEHDTKESDYKRKWIKSHPEYPSNVANTGTPRNLYVTDLYNAAKQRGEKVNYFEMLKKHSAEFQTLSTKKQQKYIDMSAKAKEENSRQLQAFYQKVGYNPAEMKKAKTSRTATASSRPKVKTTISAASKRKNLFPDAPEIPITPEKLYAHAQVTKLHPDAEGKEYEQMLVNYAANYIALEPKNRMKYIKKCIRSAEKFAEEAEEYMKTHPGYLFPHEGTIQFLIEKTELTTWEAANGRPEKPPSNAQDMFKAELIEKGEFNPDDYETEEEAKKALSKKWKSLNWSQHSSYTMAKYQEEHEYLRKLKEYYENAPAIMKPLIKTTLPPKLRSEILQDATTIVSPRKRKVEHAEHEASEEVSAVPKKSKKHKKDKERIEEQEAGEDADEEIAAVNKASSHKKKKKITLINDIIRGIFDARPALGRSYSVYYYYAKEACSSKIWIQRLNSEGVIETAGLLIRSYISMTDEAKDKWETKQAQRQNISLFQVKQEDDEAKLETMFVGEPVPPPPGLWDYYRRSKPSSDRQQGAWKYADWETKRQCAKEHHQAMKQYIRDYENYILRMTPTDLALYTAAKSDTWQTHSKNTLDVILDNTAFLPTRENLVKEVCPDAEDSPDTPVVLALELEPTNADGQSDRHISTTSVFSNDEFLQQLEGYLN